MSFGFSISDFAILYIFTRKTDKNCKNAGPEYSAIARELRSLQSVLKIVRDESETTASVLATSNKYKTEIRETISSCKNVLNDVGGSLGKYGSLQNPSAHGSRKVWQKIKFGATELEQLGIFRSRIITYTSSIAIFLDIAQIAAIGRVERKVDDGFDEMRQAIYSIARNEHCVPNSTFRLSLSTYDGDDKEVWRKFRIELVSEGFSSHKLHRHKEVLMSYMTKLESSGILEPRVAEGLVSAHGAKAAILPATNNPSSDEYGSGDSFPDEDQVVASDLPGATMSNHDWHHEFDIEIIPTDFGQEFEVYSLAKQAIDAGYGYSFGQYDHPWWPPPPGTPDASFRVLPGGQQMMLVLNESDAFGAYMHIRLYLSPRSPNPSP